MSSQVFYPALELYFRKWSSGTDSTADQSTGLDLDY